MKMDKFDNDISKMHSQIDVIKSNIDSMKYKNQKAMSSIMESIHSLSKPKSSQTTRSIQVTPKEKTKRKIMKDGINANIQLNDINDIDANLTKNYSNCFWSKQQREQFKANANRTTNNLHSERQKLNYHMMPYQTPSITTEPQQAFENNKSSIALCYSRAPTIKKEPKRDFHNKTLSIKVNNKSVGKPTEGIINNEQYYALENSIPDSKMVIMTENNVNAQFDYNNMEMSLPQPSITSIKKQKRDKTYNTYNKPSIQPYRTTSTHRDYSEQTYKKIVNELIEVMSNHNEESINPNELVDKVKFFLSKSKAKEALVSNIHKLYLTDHNVDDALGKVEIIDLWKWIHQLSRTEEDYQRSEAYRMYCEGIMAEYNLRSFDEMKLFVDELLCKNSKNEKFVEGMKKILCNETMKKKKVSHHNSFNNSQNAYYKHNNSTQNQRQQYK